MNLPPTHSTPKSMVAENPLKKPKSKRGGFQQRIPLPQKLKARSLYIIQQLAPQEIANQLGLTRDQVQQLAYRERWTPLKQKARSALLNKADARIQEQVTEIQEAFGLKSEELGLRSLDKLSDSLDRRDPNAARDSQAYSQTAKNLYGIVRQARNLDTQQSEGKLGSVVVFLGDLPRVSSKSDPINVTPISPALPLPSPKEAPISVTEGKDTGAEPVAPMD